jgi:hypothetical protein
VPAIDDRDDDWHAVAITPMPFAPLFDTSPLIIRPWKKDKQQRASLPQDIKFSLVAITKCSDGRVARKAITNAEYSKLREARLQVSGIAQAIDRLGPQDHEAAVSTIWIAILSFTFPALDGYLIEQARSSSSQFALQIVRQIKQSHVFTWLAFRCPLGKAYGH